MNLKSKTLLKALKSMAVGVLAIAPGAVLSAEESNAPTYYKDVLPIFQESCIECHREGQLAPMALDTFKAVRPWVRSIRNSVVMERTMPPWFADPAHGHFKNDTSLNEDQIQTIRAWAAAGGPAGDPNDAPVAREYPERWSLGEPDAIFTMQEPHFVKADGPDEYMYFTIPTNFTEDKWITSLEIDPGFNEVVHHVIVFVKEPGDESGNRDELGRESGRESGAVKNNSYRPESAEELQKVIDREERLKAFSAKRTLREQPLRLMGMIGGIAPGMPPWEANRNEGRMIKAGSTLVFQMHYHPSGNEGWDQTSVGVKFAKGPVAKQRYTTGIFNIAFSVPPGADDYEVTAAHKVNEDIHILSFMPHMHLRGKAFEYKAIFPDGREQVLLSVPQYDFDWQLVYELEEAIAIPRGTEIHCRALFDNSENNPDNPDPEAIVRFGEPTTDEMMIGWFDFTRDAELFGGFEG